VILVVGKRKKYSIAFIAMHVEKVFAIKNSVELYVEKEISANFIVSYTTAAGYS
jgi:hypothetical protein